MPLRYARSPFEVGKAIVVLKMIAGRYATDRLSRHWTKDNPEGLCRLPGCSSEVGDLPHILTSCPALDDTRTKMISLWTAFLVPRPNLLPVIKEYTISNENLFIQFLLDPSCLPMVISSTRTNQNILQDCLYLTRTWCYAMHLTRSRLMKQ